MGFNVGLTRSDRKGKSLLSPVPNPHPPRQEIEKPTLQHQAAFQGFWQILMENQGSYQNWSKGVGQGSYITQAVAVIYLVGFVIERLISPEWREEARKLDHAFYEAIDKVPPFEMSRIFYGSIWYGRLRTGLLSTRDCVARLALLNASW